MQPIIPGGATGSPRDDSDAFSSTLAPSTTDILPFTIRIVRTEEQLQKVCELRSVAYGHHLPALKEHFSKPDPLDREPGTVILLAEDKATRQAVGTARLQPNAGRALMLEHSVALPEHLRHQPLVEITRFSVRPGYNQHRVRMSLVKACYLFSLAMQIRGIVITARRSLVRQYQVLGFADVFEDQREVPCAHVGGLNHRVLMLDARCVERNWHAMNHPFYDFLFEMRHPDIEIFTAVSSGWSRPRLADRAAPADTAAVASAA